MKPGIFFLVGFFLLFPGTSPAQTSRFWRPDERTVLTDFTTVRALAGGRTYLFVATDLGLLVYDHVFQRWELPFTYLDGYPPGAVVVALADPTDESVWLGTRTGLLHYRHRTNTVDSIPVPGGVIELILDADAPSEGLHVRTTNGWEFLARGAFSTQPSRGLPRRRLVVTTVREALNRYPTLDASRAFLLLDERLRQARYTSAFFFPDSDRIAMGTDGMGTILVDPLVSSFERLEYGLVSVGAGALAVDGEDVWAGSYGGWGRNGFTRMSGDLRSFQFYQGPRAVGFNFRVVRDLEVSDGTLFAATEVGLLVIRPGENQRIISSDLPSRDVFTVLKDETGVWVGTSRGLVFVDEDFNVSPELGAAGRKVYDMARIGDSVWLATDAGLAMIEPNHRRVGVPIDLLNNMDLMGPVILVAALADTLVVVTRDNRIVWRAGTEGDWHAGLRVTGVGIILSIEPDEGGVWIGGEIGIGFLQFASSTLRIFNAPRDLPGPARDIAVTPDHVWVATDRGVVRFSKRGLR